MNKKNLIKKIKQKKATVGVVGLGYVGIVTTAALAKIGHQIIGFDSDLQKVKDCQNGDIRIHEPNLAPLIREGLAAGNIKFTHNQDDVGPLGDLAIVTVGTPSQNDGNQ